MAVGRMTVVPWVGPPGTVVDVTAPAWSTVDFAQARNLTVHLAPQTPPPGLPPSTTFFGYPQSSTILSPQSLTFTIGGIASNPRDGLVPGVYEIFIIDALEYINVGSLQVLTPGQSTAVLPPGAEFVNWWIGPYIPNWKPGGYSGYNAPPGWTFWYDSPQHPCTETNYWFNLANWGTGSWKWTSLPAHSPPRWSIVWDNDSLHGSNTSLHGWILQPDNPSTPAPGVQWPPWPTTTPAPAVVAPPVMQPVMQTLPPAMPGAPLPALALGLVATPGPLPIVPGGPKVIWPAQSVPPNPERREALYFVSDLHLGDGSRAEDFVAHCSDPQTTLSDGDWVRMISWICADVQDLVAHEIVEGARLIWNGDILDLWSAGSKPGTPGPGSSADYQTRLANILARHPAFFTGLKQFLSQNAKNKLIYLRGNHDEAMLRFASPLMDDLVTLLPGLESQIYKGNARTEEDAYIDDGFALIAEHGNVNDSINYDLIDFSSLVPPGPVLMMKGQVFVEEFVNWIEMNGVQIPPGATFASLISSLLLVDNVPLEWEFAAYINSWSASSLKASLLIAKMWAKLASALIHARMLPGSSWVRAIENNPNHKVVETALISACEQDNVLLGRGEGGKAQDLADDILDGKRMSLPGGKPLIVGLGHTHEKIWCPSTSNGFRQLYFNTNTWTPKYELSSFNPISWELRPLVDSADEPRSPVVRVVPHQAFATGRDPTDPHPGVDVLNDMTLNAPPNRGKWQARVTYCKLSGGVPITTMSASTISTKIYPLHMEVKESLDSSEFVVVVQGGKPTSYKWTLVSPVGAGNNPLAPLWNVLSDNGTGPTATIKHSRWCASPDSSRGIVAGPNVLYDVMCEVTVNQIVYSSYAHLEVYVPDPLGDTTWPAFIGWDTIKVSKRQIIGKKGKTEWFVSGQDSFRRTTPKITIHVASGSQFFDKVMAHENKHFHQFTQEAPWKSLWDADVLYTNTLSKLTYIGQTSQDGEGELRKKIKDAVNHQHSIDHQSCTHTIQDLELGANQADRAILPHYLEATDDDVQKQYPRPPY